MVMEEELERSNFAGFEEGEQGQQTGTQKASRSWKQPGKRILLGSLPKGTEP